jgi:hypothetical protein
MSFRFRVQNVWFHTQRQVCDVIGVLEEGSIVPPIEARITERPNETVRIDSIALGSTLPNRQQTLVVSGVTGDPQALEGCLLCDA